MSFCTIEQVKQAISFPSDGAPLADAVIGNFIKDAEEEIEDIYKTKFGSIEDYGTADGDCATTTFSDTSKTWEINDFVGYIVWIYGGTGNGQYSEIQSNTKTKLTFNTITTTPDATSTYRILKLGYKDETIDGSGNDEMFINYQPLINLNSLTIDSTSVTPGYVYQDNSSGRLRLKTTAEVRYFSNTNPQQNNIKYINGENQIPTKIQKLYIRNE